MEKLEHKLIIMREMHEEHQNRASNTINNNNNNSTTKTEHTYQHNNNNANNNIDTTAVESELDPFYDNQENHNLIGVANIFLECLFSEVKLSYHVPIISQQAEVAGRLQVRLKKKKKTRSNNITASRSSWTTAGTLKKNK